MIFNVGPSGLSPYPNFKFTVGNTEYVIDAETATHTQSEVYYYYRSGNDWEFYMLTSGTLLMINTSLVDLFMCGGGNSGGNGSYSVGQTWDTSTGRWLYYGTNANGGSGGSGGTRKTESGIILSGSNAIVCAAPGGTSSIGNYASNAAGYSRSGHHANGGYSFDDSTAKGPDGHGYRVGAGGGNGGTYITDGSSPSNTPAESGGDRKGGDGGSGSSASNGSKGDYWGAGGGGGGAWCNTNWTYSESGHGGKGNGAVGKKGFCAIRNAR